MTPADLDVLDRLMAIMQERGATHVRVGDVAVVLPAKHARPGVMADAGLTQRPAPDAEPPMTAEDASAVDEYEKWLRQGMNGSAQ